MDKITLKSNWNKRKQDKNWSNRRW